MKYSIVKSTGAFVDKSSLRNGQKAKIVSETVKEPSKFLNEDGTPKMQDNAKVHFEGQKESVNVSINRASINALVEAYGDDSVAWQNKYLTVEVEKMRVAGKAVTALYLIPEGYKKIDDSEGYAVIVKDNLTSAGTEVPFSDSDSDVKVEEIPF